MVVQKAIICDLDGTLADHRHRLHFIQPHQKLFVDEGKAYGIPEMEENFGYVCFNRDGTVFKGKDWEAFYAAMDRDSINKHIFNLVEMIYDRHYNRGTLLEIICVTGRPEKYREITENWFHGNFHHYNIFPKLFMRPDFLPFECPCRPPTPCYNEPKPDHRPAHEVKQEIFEREIQGQYEVIFVLENDLECAEMYRGLGLTILKVCLP